jgi:hypothetical protein
MKGKRDFNENQRYDLRLYAGQAQDQAENFYGDISGWASKYKKYDSAGLAGKAKSYFEGLDSALEKGKDDIDKMFTAAEEVENEYAEKFEGVAFEMGLYADRINALLSVLQPVVPLASNTNPFAAPDFEQRLEKAKQGMVFSAAEQLMFLLESYAGPEEPAGYRLSGHHSPEDLLKYLTPEQRSAYSSVIDFGNYNDEQKCRMLLSAALGIDIGGLMALQDEDRLVALQEQMEKLFASGSASDKDKAIMLLDIKWSEFGADYLRERLTGYFAQMVLSGQNPADLSFKEKVAEIFDLAYQKLPRKYDALFDGYGVPQWLKYAATFAVNKGGKSLNIVAKNLLQITMLGDFMIDTYDAEANKANNKQYSVTGFIDEQITGTAAKIQMGVHTGDYNGCGWIATYNVLHMLGKDMQPWEIVAHYDKTGGALIDGNAGVNPEAISLFFTMRGIKTKTTYLPDNVDELIKKSGVAIFNYVHSSGAHYVAVEYKDGKFVIYNDNDENTALAASSIDAWMQRREWLPLSITTFK